MFRPRSTIVLGAHRAPARKRSGGKGAPRATEPGSGAEPLLILFSISLSALTLAVGCSGFAEQSILNQFFTASRLRDNTSLANITMVSFEPRTQGTVTKFDIVSVTPEQRKPLTLKALAQAHLAAKADDAAFTKRKDEYQTENLEAIQRVLKADRERAKLKGKDAEVQATWSKFVQDGVAVSRKVTDAKRRLANDSGLVDLSIN